MRPSRIGRLLRCERGEGMVSALILLAGVLVPLIFLVALFGRIEQARLAVSQAAQAAVRAAVEAPTAESAQTAADQQLADQQAQTAAALSMQLTGSFERGGVIEADVTCKITIGRLPLLGDFGTITVHASARAPVDQYRSLPNPTSP